MLVYADKIFENPVMVIKAFNNEEFLSAFDQLENLRNIYYLVGYVRYEAYKIFQNIQVTSKEPLLYFEAFRNYRNLETTSLDLYKTYSYAKVNKSQYISDIEFIKNQIALGNTYEVNYTIPHIVWSEEIGFKFFMSLLSEQKTPYNAYIRNDYEEVLSFSPELFFKVKNGKIYTKPMKGTVARGVDEVEDDKNKKFLLNDEKNRAENVMIVDLLRNDLSRIAKVGTVNVDKLFEIETHKTLHQMTSEISAELDDDMKLFEIFRAIFPCGSVTGAPKISTMKIIDEIEHNPRDIYCGAIGLINKDFCEFSVPIRILQRKKHELAYTCHTGGAVVWDSEPLSEYEEAILKRKFLNINRFEYSLIDTLVIKNGEIPFEMEHLQRLNFKIPDNFKSEDCILRIKKSLNSEINIEKLPLKPIINTKVCFSDVVIDSSNPLLYLKTDFRPWYEESMRKIKNGDIFDELYFNERGELTEGARSNVIVEKNGNLYTPPINCGLLNGIYRQFMLKNGKCSEKILYKEDLINADAIYCCNSVRGLVRVELCL